MGWQGEAAGPQAQGKRIRPLLVLLVNTAAGGTWQSALPAAAAIESIHNFSLIHDDIEDNSPLRRNRPTVWKLWGIPKAINAGDALFSLAFQEMLRLSEYFPDATVLRAVNILQQACLQLTRGQQMDIASESLPELSLDDYWPIIEGKTAALLAACTELGALTANAPPESMLAYRQYGHQLGLAFQVQDDLLGVWGDASLTGKSSESDLVTGKKSLPVCYGLSRKGQFYQRWIQGPLTPSEVPHMAALLVSEGARDYTQQTSDRLTRQAILALDSAGPSGEAAVALGMLTDQLLNRQA